ncbi:MULTISPECIES: 23S rRNA pseudouridine(2605) synthase RluB [unclassified Thiomonas]|jgi:23S rRNA pseudouridine2605 synthase|uniref:23S rRNA pseudouridine(2605) synthase RluB n=1 Tax=unclassified Thiomonas TaxID=2625466 RepID=UPI000BDACE9B|nr:MULTISPECIES: pseudouridine synthase [unclassified Thiomonas]OZB72405.1 MAG: 23S rRNA pseudouridylate synthase B [Thiomonas sp. 13-64-67]
MSSTDSPDSPELNPAPEAVEAVADTPPARKTRAAPRRTPRKTAAASTEEGAAPESGEAVAPPIVEGVAALPVEPEAHSTVSADAGVAEAAEASPQAEPLPLLEPKRTARPPRSPKSPRHQTEPQAPQLEATTPAAAAPAPLVGVQIQDVISGTYDQAAETAEIVRRVLAPAEDAPKLHKVLAQSGVGSRREMEDLILAGRVSVNGEPAHLGQRILPTDQIRVNGKIIKRRLRPAQARVLAYHKPTGEVVSFKDPEGRPTVFQHLPKLQGAKWTAVGRLDINTEGLLLFTTSGDLANRLMHPSYGAEREYAVRVLGELDAAARDELLEGVQLGDGPARFLSLEEAGGEGANRWWRVVISEGRNREVRRMFEAVGLTVSRLIRVRYASVVLPAGLRRGDFVELDKSQVQALQGRSGEAPSGAGDRPARRPNGQNQGGRRNDSRGSGRGGRGKGQGGDQQQPGPDSYARTTVEALFGKSPVVRSGGGSWGGAGNFSTGNKPGGQSRRKSGGKQGSSQPDPMKTSFGYIHKDAGPHRAGGGGGPSGGRRRSGGGGSGGGGGGNRGGR